MSIQVPRCTARKNNLYTGEVPVRLAAFRRMRSGDLSAACGEEAGMTFHSDGMKQEEIGFTNFMCYTLLLFLKWSGSLWSYDYFGQELTVQEAVYDHKTCYLTLLSLKWVKKWQKMANIARPSKPTGWSTVLCIHSNFCLHAREYFLTMACRIGPLKFKLLHTWRSC